MENPADSLTLEPEAPSGTVTFLFTDIEGSTKLLERLREQYAVLLDHQRQILRAAFARWNGREIDTQGDSFFTVFPRAIDAVCCVIEAQRELAAHDWPQGAVVGVRMGLHTGEPIQVRTGYVGMDVHRASRIAAAGHGGQVLVSQTTRDLVFQDLPKGTFLLDLGEHKLKDIRFPQQIYQLNIEGLPAEFPPLKTLALEEEPPTPGEAPYKGLQYFDEADAEWFFGREQVSLQLVKAVLEQRFLAVIGASGSGKSSVVRAGLVPALKHSQPDRWQVHIFTPSSHPLESLAVSLTQQEQSVTAVTTLNDDLRREPRSLHFHIRRSIPQDSLIEVLLVVDQFEELFTQCRDEQERQAFVDNLLYAVGSQGSPLRLVIALRADFYQHLAQYAGLRSEVAKHQEYLGAMEAVELRQAIEEPALRGGWEFSPGLVELMLHDIGATEGHQPEPGALPLLSHALLETWRRRRGNLMNLRAYSEAGGVRGAIAKTAESVYYGELTPEQQPIARNIFLRLTELGEGTQDTRRRAAISELVPPAPYGDPKLVEDVLTKLADARLITTSEGSAEVAHEALIREWPTLRDWLAQDREGLRAHRHLTEASREWELLEHDPGALYRGARLVQALEWAQANPSQLNVQEQAFLDVSREASQREAREREEHRQRELEAARTLAATQTMAAKRLRRRALYLLAALVVAALLAAAAGFFGQQSNRNAQIAGQNLATAQSESQRAEREALQRATQQSIAEGEANTRATAESQALQERQAAEGQSHLATSRELAASAISNLESDPELSILLALQALQITDSVEAQNALHRAILASRLRVAIPAYRKEAFGVDVSPDGSQFAAAATDGLIKIWALKDGLTTSDQPPLLEIPNPIDFDIAGDAAGYTLAYSPDGSLLAAVGENHTAKIWKAATGELVQTLTGHQDDVLSVSFSPNGARLATTSKDLAARVWEVATGKELLNFTPHRYGLGIAVFSPDGKQLVTYGADDTYTAKVWDLGAKPVKELLSLDFNGSNCMSIVFSPDGKVLAFGIDSDTQVWNYQQLLANPASPPSVHLFGSQRVINRLLFSPDGQQIVTGSADGTAKIWDAATGQQLFSVAGRGPIMSIALHPDGAHLMAAIDDGSVKIWDISTQGSQEWFTIPNAYRGRFSLDGKRLVTFGDYLPGSMVETRIKNQFWELSPAGAKELRQLVIDPGYFFPFAWTMSPDESRIIIPGVDYNTRVWDAATGQLLQSFPISQTLSSIGHTGWVVLAEISPDGSRLLTAGKDGKAILWDLATGKPLFELALPTPELAIGAGIQFSPDGSQIATAGNDASARLWDANTGELLRVFPGSSGFLSGVVFSPDGKRILTGNTDSSVKLWDAQSGKELLSMSGHTINITALAFSNDGRLMASGDGKTIVWDAQSGRQLVSLPGYIDQFTPGGKGLVIHSREASVRLVRGFYIDLAELVALAQSRVMRSLTPLECQQYLHTPQCPAQ